MSATEPPPEPPSAENTPERSSAARNPWLWATAAVAVRAIAFDVWGLHEHQGLKQAADQIMALAPKCKDSVASAGG